MSVGKYVFCIYRNTEIKINCKKREQIVLVFNSERGIRTLDTAGMNRML